MGRVDEAMRRAAGVSDPKDARPQETGERHTADVEFPTEGTRPRLWTVQQQPEAVEVKPAPGRSMLPELAGHMAATLSRKVVIDRETDPASKEQYRRLAATLHAMQATNGLKVVMVASAIASEGKSLTAANLSLTLSESYQKSVLLIDGDLRRPSQHVVFGLESSPGLTDGLRVNREGRVKLHRVTSHLTVLTAGEASTDPMAVLSSEQMHQLIAESRETFDWVIVDTPPVGLLSDANLLSEMADGAILVVRAESTPYDVVQRAVAMLGRDRLLGVVLNRARLAGVANYRYHSYYQAAGGGPPARG